MAAPQTNLTHPDSPDAPRTLIELRQVVKAYETPAGTFTALKNVDLTVNSGEFVAVIGKSGSGKSTLINMITGIDRPTLGEVIVGGRPIHNFNEDQMARWRGVSLGVIFQFFQLLPTLTVIENVMLPMELRSTYPAAERKERALHFLDQVELADQAYKFPSAISGGQQQRVAIARALVNDPDVLVGDEPTGSLDSKTADSIFRLFEGLVAQGKTILIVTHDRDLAGRIPRVVFINDGEITDQYVAQALPSMTQQELARVSSRLDPVKFAPGEVIVRQGDPANAFYIIVSGEVDVFIHHASGAELVTGEIGPGGYFGEMGLLEGGVRTATVRAKPDSEVTAMQLDRDTFASVIGNSDLTREQLINLMRQRVMEQQVVEALPTIGVKTIEEVVRGAQSRTFKPGEYIIQQGETAQSFYILTEGELEVLRGGAGDEQKVIGYLQPGQLFGEIGLLEGEPRSASVRVVGSDPATVIVMGRDGFAALLDDSDMTHEELAQTMRQRVMEQRLAAALPTVGLDRLEKLMSGADRTTYSPGSTVYRAGDDPDYFYVIVSGQAEVQRVGASDGRVLSQDQFFGERGLLERAPRSESVRAVGDEDLVVIQLHRDSFTNILSTTTITKLDLLQLMSQHLDEVPEAEQPSLGSTMRIRREDLGL